MMKQVDSLSAEKKELVQKIRDMEVMQEVGKAEMDRYWKRVMNDLLDLNMQHREELVRKMTLQMNAKQLKICMMEIQMSLGQWKSRNMLPVGSKAVGMYN